MFFFFLHLSKWTERTEALFHIKQLKFVRKLHFSIGLFSSFLGLNAFFIPDHGNFSSDFLIYKKR